MEDGRSFSVLQHLLTLAHSEELSDQQKASIELSKLVEGSSLPVVSFGPLAHALCRLMVVRSPTVGSYSARAVKVLLVDDSLRPHAVAAGVPGAVCEALHQWEDEVLCARELLAAVQTLCCEKSALKAMLQHDVFTHLLDFSSANDMEVRQAAMAALANALCFVDTLLLEDNLVTELVASAAGSLVHAVRTSTDPSYKCYAAAAVANASAHPKLAAALLTEGALQTMSDMERQAGESLNLGGSKLVECAQTAVYRLSDRQRGDPKAGLKKYMFKWGTRPMMELTLSPGANRAALAACGVLWVLLLLTIFYPLALGHR